MKKAARASILVTTILLAIAVIAEAQQTKKIPRIGYLRAETPPAVDIEAFRRGLREYGYVEGKNMVVEYHLEQIMILV